MSCGVGEYPTQLYRKVFVEQPLTSNGCWDGTVSHQPSWFITMGQERCRRHRQEDFNVHLCIVRCSGESTDELLEHELISCALLAVLVFGGAAGALGIGPLAQTFFCGHDLRRRTNCNEL